MIVLPGAVPGGPGDNVLIQASRTLAAIDPTLDAAHEYGAIA